MEPLIGRARDRWRVVEESNGEVHVYPIDKDGENHQGHEMRAGCWCQPRRDSETPNLIVHNETH